MRYVAADLACRGVCRQNASSGEWWEWTRMTLNCRICTNDISYCQHADRARLWFFPFLSFLVSFLGLTRPSLLPAPIIPSGIIRRWRGPEVCPFLLFTAGRMHTYVGPYWELSAIEVRWCRVHNGCYESRSRCRLYRSTHLHVRLFLASGFGPARWIHSRGLGEPPAGPPEHQTHRPHLKNPKAHRGKQGLLMIWGWMGRDAGAAGRNERCCFKRTPFVACVTQLSQG